MTFTIQFGWWLIPFAVTTLSYFWAYYLSPPAMQSYGAGAIVGLLLHALASIASLLAWFLWALLT